MIGTLISKKKIQKSIFVSVSSTLLEKICTEKQKHQN